MGVMRRGGDGKDLRWFTGQNLFCTHVMGGWSDGDKVTVDWDGGEGNQFPFFPSKSGPFDPAKATGLLRRFTIDLSSSSNDRYQTETIFPEVSGVLARQDDRFHTLKYRYGYLNGFGPSGGWWIVDHEQKTTQLVSVPDYQLNEATFVPRTKDAPEGDGYLVGIGASTKEGGRSDLIFVDTKDIAAGRWRGSRCRSRCRPGPRLLGRRERDPGRERRMKPAAWARDCSWRSCWCSRLPRRRRRRPSASR
jgi:carotenoid cleavage dioxygenase